MIRLDLSDCKGFANHRSGWSYCINSLKPLHSKSGIFVDDFIERSFSWELWKYFKDNQRQLPYKKNWIGFFHNPPNMPEWFDYINSPQAILNREIFQQSLKTCKALIVLSDYLKEWLESQINIPIVSAKHPTEKTELSWNPDSFFAQNKRPLIQLGYWLRKMFSICELRTGTKWQKIWLPSDKKYADIMMSVEEKTKLTFWETKYKWSAINKLDRIENNEFDKLMSQGIIFLDLYDSSANNAVVESIARNTPVLVNKIPAVVEYLGADYPFYFDRLEEAEAKLIDDDLIIKTHLYLKNMDKRWISGGYFAMDLSHKLEAVL